MVVSEGDGRDLVEALNRDGLLSPVMDQWRLDYLSRFEDWFAFCRELNRATMKLWLDHWRRGEGETSAALAPTAGRALGRCLTNFAGAVVLCERALAIEAASLARSIVESSFWLAYMAASPDRALSDLEADDLKSFIDRERELQRVWTDDLEEVARSKSREASYIAKLAGRKRPRIADIGRTYGSWDGYLQYRILSGIYGHISQASLRHNFLRTGEGSGMNILGPHEEEVPRALNFAARGLIDGFESYAGIVGDQASREHAEAWRRRLEALPKLS